MSGVMIDWKEGTEHSLSPFFGAGTAKAVDWIHRNEGIKTNAAGLVDDMDEISNTSSGKTAVLSASISGIAGYTRFQGSVSLVEIPV
jgi:hypothetical protein